MPKKKEPTTDELFKFWEKLVGKEVLLKGYNYFAETSESRKKIEELQQTLKSVLDEREYYLQNWNKASQDLEEQKKLAIERQRESEKSEKIREAEHKEIERAHALEIENYKKELQDLKQELTSIKKSSIETERDLRNELLLINRTKVANLSSSLPNATNLINEFESLRSEWRESVIVLFEDEVQKFELKQIAEISYQLFQVCESFAEKKVLEFYESVGKPFGIDANQVYEIPQCKIFLDKFGIQKFIDISASDSVSYSKEIISMLNDRINKFENGTSFNPVLLTTMSNNLEEKVDRLCKILLKMKITKSECSLHFSDQLTSTKETDGKNFEALFNEKTFTHCVIPAMFYQTAVKKPALVCKVDLDVPVISVSNEQSKATTYTSNVYRPTEAQSNSRDTTNSDLEKNFRQLSISNKPQEGEKEYQEADSLISSKRFYLAQSKLQTAASCDYPPAYIRLLNFYFETGSNLIRDDAKKKYLEKIRERVEWFERYRDDYNPNSLYQLYLVYTFLNMKSFERGELLKKAAAHNHPLALYTLGLEEIAAGNKDEAKECFLKAGRSPKGF